MRPIGLPGQVARPCPACAVPVSTVREPADDTQPESVLYDRHRDGAGKQCVMSGKRAALAAVAFGVHT